MRASIPIALETFRLLRRDRIFVPAWLAGLAIAILAGLASDWSLEDFDKVLVDIAFFGFQCLGGAIAVFWGTKTIADAMSSGAIEVQLAAPVGRGTWLVGRYLGLALALVALGFGIAAIWQLTCYARQSGGMRDAELIAIAFTVLGWLVLAGVAMSFSCYAGQGIAVFATLSVWIAGLASPLVYATLPQDTSEGARLVLRLLTQLLDFQTFNLIDWANGLAHIEVDELWARAAYGFVFIAFSLQLGMLGWLRRDIAHGL